MIDGGKLILLPAQWSDYRRFQSLCCVDTVPAVAGQCWIAALQDVDGVAFIDREAGFIGYSYPFRHNGIRLDAMPFLSHRSPRSRLAILNRYCRTLTRVMVKPQFRGRGIASELIRQTVDLVGVPFIECLTFTDSIARLLLLAGFKNYGKTGGMGCDYFLRQSLQVPFAIEKSGHKKTAHGIDLRGLLPEQQSSAQTDDQPVF
jgi:GNAT superfamily N-acetyltransferase